MYADYFCGQFPEPKESVIHVFYALKCLPSRASLLPVIPTLLVQLLNCAS